MEGDRGFHIVRWRASGESALGDGACHALGEAGGLASAGDACDFGFNGSDRVAPH